MRVRRIDAVTVLRPTRLDAIEVSGEGYQLYDAIFARTGLQSYSDGRGGTMIELRPFEEVRDSLPSYELRPLTDLHPARNITTDTARVLARGAMSGAHFLEDNAAELEQANVGGRLAVWDKALQAKFDAATASGKPMQLSMGYTLDLDPTPGQHFGRHFDAVQRGMRINHGAAVPDGRAGTAQVIVDGWCFDDAQSLADVVAHAANPIFVDLGRWSRSDAGDLRTAIYPNRTKPTMKLKTKIDGQDVEVTIADGATTAQQLEAVAQAHVDAATAKDAAHKLALAKALDAFSPAFLAAQKKKKGEEAEEDKKKAKKDAADALGVESRIDALSKAAGIIGVSYDGAGKTATQVNLDVVEHVLGKPERDAIEAMDAADQPGATKYARARAVNAYAARPTNADDLVKTIRTALNKRNDTKAKGGHAARLQEIADAAENPNAARKAG